MSFLYTVYVLAFTIAIPSIIGLVKFKRLSKSLKLITLLLLLGLFTEGVMLALALLKMNNLFAVHFYTLVEIVFLSLYFHQQIRNFFVRKIILITIVGLSGFTILYALTVDNIEQFNSIPRAIECLYFSLLSGWLFYEMSDYLKPIDEAHYFINGAILFYFSSCFLIFSFNKYYASDPGIIVSMIKVHAYINAFCNFVYAMGLWITSRRYSFQS